VKEEEAVDIVATGAAMTFADLAGMTTVDPGDTTIVETTVAEEGVDTVDGTGTIVAALALVPALLLDIATSVVGLDLAVMTVVVVTIAEAVVLTVTGGVALTVTGDIVRRNDDREG
jgi:hypothetical protein